MLNYQLDRWRGSAETACIMLGIDLYTNLTKQLWRVVNATLAPPIATRSMLKAAAPNPVKICTCGVHAGRQLSYCKQALLVNVSARVKVMHSERKRREKSE